MKHESRHADRFDALLKRIQQEHTAEPPAELDAVTQMVVGFLEWNATNAQAVKAHAQLMAELVDNNDLRVSLPQELVALIGEKYPQADERVSRLREVLHEVYAREHAVALDSLAGKPKKQVRTYIESLPGITPYVSALVMLLGFSVHAMPVDDRLAALLGEEEAVDPDATLDEIGQFIGRRVKAGEMVGTHTLLRVWADSQQLRPPAAAKTSPQNKAEQDAAPTAETESDGDDSHQE